MGISPQAKAWIRNQFNKAFLTSEEVVRAGLQMPKVVIIDFTYITKYVRDFDTGLDYIRHQVIPEFSGYFTQGCETVILVFDRFSPINKYEEHQQRYTTVAVTPTPETVEDVINVVTAKGKENVTGALKKFIASNAKTGSSITSSSSSKLKSDSSSWGYYGSDMTISDIQKFEEQKERLKEEAALTRMYEAKDPAALLVVTDLVMPTKDKWSSVMANKQLRREMMHYLTCSLVRNEETPEITYKSGVYKRKVGDGSSLGSVVGDFIHTGFTPPPSRFLCIHGGQTSKPTREAALTQSYVPDDFLIVLSTETIAPQGGMSSGGMYRTKRTVSKANEYHPPSVLSKLGEGEVACMYYSLCHVWDDQIIVTGDGDTMFLALLASRFRLKEDMRQFKNTVHVLLRLPHKKSSRSKVTVPMRKKGVKFNQSTNAYQSEPESASNNSYVNINTLYESIVYGEEFGKFTDPVATFVGVMSLMKNDFIKRFAPGMGGGMDNSTETPWVLVPLLQNPLKYKNMIRILDPEPNLPYNTNPNIEVNTTFKNTSYTSRWGCDNGNRKTYYPNGILKDILMERTTQFQVEIDEDLFIKYVYECYYWKYKDVGAIQKAISRSRVQISKRAGLPKRGKSAVSSYSSSSSKNRQQKNTSYFPQESNLEDIDFEFSRTQLDKEKRNRADEEVSKEEMIEEPMDATAMHHEEVKFCLEHIRSHLCKGKREENQVMEDGEIIAFSRRLKWLLSYWINGYIGNCTYPNPCETYEGKSYYGWERVADNYNGCTSTPDVSPPKPINRNKWGSITTPFKFGRAQVKKGGGKVASDSQPNSSFSSSNSIPSSKVENSTSLSIGNLKKTWAFDNERVTNGEGEEVPITPRSGGGVGGATTTPKLVDINEEFLPGVSFGPSTSKQKESEDRTRVTEDIPISIPIPIPIPIPPKSVNAIGEDPTKSKSPKVSDVDPQILMIENIPPERNSPSSISPTPTPVVKGQVKKNVATKPSPPPPPKKSDSQTCVKSNTSSAPTVTSTTIQANTTKKRQREVPTTLNSQQVVQKRAPAATPSKRRKLNTTPPVQEKK